MAFLKQKSVGVLGVCRLSPHVNTACIIHIVQSCYIYNLITLCLNGTLPCVDFMDVIMGDIPIYNLITLCLNGTLPSVDFMDVITGDIPVCPVP